MLARVKWTSASLLFQPLQSTYLEEVVEQRRGPALVLGVTVELSEPSDEVYHSRQARRSPVRHPHVGRHVRRGHQEGGQPSCEQIHGCKNGKEHRVIVAMMGLQGVELWLKGGSRRGGRTYIAAYNRIPTGTGHRRDREKG